LRREGIAQACFALEELGPAIRHPASWKLYHASILPSQEITLLRCSQVALCTGFGLDFRPYYQLVGKLLDAESAKFISFFIQGLLYFLADFIILQIGIGVVISPAS